jgi:hypothetical protein
VFTYSLVGADNKRIDRLNDAVRKLKESLEPTLKTEDWRFHMKEMRSGQDRKAHTVFSRWDERKMAQAIDGLFEIVSTTEDIMPFSFSLVAPLSTPAAKQKHSVYITLLEFIINLVTGQDGKPQLYFDSEKPNSGGHVIHEWARRLYADAQYCLLYAYLAKGIEIPEPQFVKAGSHPCLELADFVSYVVARYHHERWTGAPDATLSPDRLGNLVYFGFNAEEKGLYTRQCGFPWDFFYGATPGAHLKYSPEQLACCGVTTAARK